MARKFLSGQDLQNQKIINLGTGSAASDAVNLGQVQALVNGLSWHGAVRVASTGNVTIATPGAAIDGVNLAAGNRVLLKDQTTGSEKGVYIWNGASTAMTRANDGTAGNLNAGAAFYVDEGTVNADTAWTLTTDDPITVGTTALTFAKFGAGQVYTRGTGIDPTQFASNVIAVDFTVVPKKYAGNVGDGTSTSITVTHNLGTQDVEVTLRDATTKEQVEVDNNATTINTVTLTFAVAPASNAYRIIVIG